MTPTPPEPDRRSPGRPRGSRQRKRAADHPLNALLDARQLFEQARRTLYGRLAAFAVGRADFEAVRDSLANYHAANAHFVGHIERVRDYDAATTPTEIIGELAKSLERGEAGDPPP